MTLEISDQRAKELVRFVRRLPQIKELSEKDERDLQDSVKAAAQLAHPESPTARISDFVINLAVALGNREFWGRQTHIKPNEEVASALQVIQEVALRILHSDLSMSTDDEPQRAIDKGLIENNLDFVSDEYLGEVILRARGNQVHS